MICRLCLISADILIPIYNSKGSDIRGIASTVQKYIGVKLVAEDKLSNKICVSCWASVENFHKFCKEITRAQQNLQRETKLEKDLPLSIGLSTENSEEPAIDRSGSNLNQDQKDDVIGKAMASEACQIMCIPEDIRAQQHPTTCDPHVIKLETNEGNVADDIGPNGSEGYDSVDEDSYACPATSISTGEVTADKNTSEKSKISRDRKSKHTLEEQNSKFKANSKENGHRKGRPRKKDAEVVKCEQALVASHIQLICEICKVVAKTFPELKQHFMDTHQRTGYAVCCKKRLYKLCNLMDHINVHENPAYFRCAQCDMNFADRVCLRNHQLLKHAPKDEIGFQCEHCGRKFAANYFLQRHLVKHMPPEQRTFHCDQCYKNYPTQSRLNSHLKNVHGNGSLKVCNLCGKVIRGKDNFERHMDRHEGVSRSSVQCAVCDQRLANKYVLRLHMELHGERKPHTCNICGKETPSSSALREHNLYHHKEPRHKCTYCEKTFKTTRSLREHITTHTGETLYSCTYCEKRFKCSSNLHAHRKWGHPDEWAKDQQTNVVAT